MLGYSNVYWISIEGLQKERDKIDQENIELQKENERFHQEIKFEKIHNADLKNELKKARRNNRASEDFGTWGHVHDLELPAYISWFTLFCLLRILV